MLKPRFPNDPLKRCVYAYWIEIKMSWNQIEFHDYVFSQGSC